MFILMTYNFGIIMAVIVGNAFGYYLFGSKREVKEIKDVPQFK
jgi:hypothetical protein